MKKKLILVGGQQFGYRYDTDKFCEYLADDLDICYICIDEGKPRIDDGKTQVVYVTKEIRYIRIFWLISEIIKQAKKEKQSVVYMSYFLGCSLVCIFLPRHKVIMDHRSGSVTKNHLKNKILNYLMRVESVFTPHLVAITEDLKNYLHLPKHTIVFPLGSDIISDTNKQFADLSLLYVGVLRGRSIHETIYGVAKFHKIHPDVKLNYAIVGGGDQSLIRNEIEKYQMNEFINVLGYVLPKDIIQYYDKGNVGVCYAPIIEAHLPQPFTKLYEYAMSGMAVISVRLPDSIRKVNENNGVLCDDNPESFAEALEQVYQNRQKYNSEHIRQEFAAYTWKNLSKQFRSIIDD
jgi:glycosyltransferase involved in cell wall biosynthesis